MPHPLVEKGSQVGRIDASAEPGRGRARHRMGAAGKGRRHEKGRCQDLYQNEGYDNHTVSRLHRVTWEKRVHGRAIGKHLRSTSFGGIRKEIRKHGEVGCAGWRRRYTTG